MRTERHSRLKSLFVSIALGLSLLFVLGIECSHEGTSAWDDIRYWTLLNQESAPGRGGSVYDDSLIVIPSTLIIPPGGSRTLTIIVHGDPYSVGPDKLDIIVKSQPRNKLSISSVKVEDDPQGSGFRTQYVVQPATSSAGIYRVLVRVDVVDWTGYEETITVIVVPSDVPGMPPAAQIAGGEYHSLAVLSDGSVVSWGMNDDGQLGDGTTISRASPVPVLGLPGPVAAVAAGGAHSLALLSDGTVWGCGDNRQGQISTTSDYWAWAFVPTRVNILNEEVLLAGIQAIAAGADHSIALTTTGAVWTGGANGSGQRGDPAAFAGNWTPVSIPLGLPIVAVAAGGDFTLALDEDGQVWGWGDNVFGQLGDNVRSQYDRPVDMHLFAGVRAIAAGSRHTLALKADGTVLAAGDNTYGQLGVEGQDVPFAVTVPRLSGIVAISAGFFHSLALGGDGKVYAWGDGSFGQLATLAGPPGASIAVLSDVQAIAAGGRHSLCLMPGCGSVWAWGDNGIGQLGDGTGASSSIPVQIDSIGEASEPGPCEVPLSVIVVGNGVVQDPLEGIECRSTWGQSFYKGTSLALTADADNDWFFERWGGDAQGTEETVRLRMDGSKNLIAYFAPAVDPPTAKFTFTPQFPFTTDKVVFDASESTDNSRIILYQWDFDNDGDFDGVMHDTTVDGSFTAAFVRKFWRAGTYTVRLRVTDDDGLTDETTNEIHVGQAEPADYDLGDAPDSSNSIGGSMLAYPADGIEAHYPTVYRASSGPQGPRHHHPQNGIYLGRTVTRENEADVGIDEDPNNNLDWLSVSSDQDEGDDGVQLPLRLPNCGWATLQYTVTAVDPPHQYMYVNVWLDWNRDGDWDDTLTCPDGSQVPEWAVRNSEQYFFETGTSTLSTPLFRCWHPSKEAEQDPLWMRITLSEEQPPSSATDGTVGYGGCGPEKGYEYGETEDYLIVPSP